MCGEASYPSLSDASYNECVAYAASLGVAMIDGDRATITFQHAGTYTGCVASYQVSPASATSSDESGSGSGSGSGGDIGSGSGVVAASDEASLARCWCIGSHTP